jgi:hypothetical protein
MAGRRLRGVAITAAAATAVAVPVLLTTSGGAQAASSASSAGAGWVVLCNSSSYWSFLAFPKRGGFASTLVKPGHCWTDDMGNRGKESIKVMGTKGRSNFKIGTVSFNGGKSSVGITTIGSAQAHGYRRF